MAEKLDFIAWCVVVFIVAAGLGAMFAFAVEGAVQTIIFMSDLGI